jgi:cyclohexanone monooxygenase
MIEAQIHYIVQALTHMRAHDLAEIEVKREAQAEFNASLVERSKGTVWTEGGCSSYYLHPVSGKNVAVWPDFTFKFAAATRHFDAQNYSVRSSSTLVTPVQAEDTLQTGTSEVA